VPGREVAGVLFAAPGLDGARDGVAAALRSISFGAAGVGLLDVLPGTGFLVSAIVDPSCSACYYNSKTAQNKFSIRSYSIKFYNRI
jgi:hypothetical protein